MCIPVMRDWKQCFFLLATVFFRRGLHHLSDCVYTSPALFRDGRGAIDEDTMKGSNLFDSREGWLRAAANELRSHFKSCGYELAENIRYAIAFPSTGRKGKRVGECWHSSASAESAYEIFIRADLWKPDEVLAVLIKELVHTLLPPDAGHGQQFKTAAMRIGLEGPMRQAVPGPLLKERLQALGSALGP